MANGTVLVTGGAGFIGSHLADELLAHGYSVRALDNLSRQVHGPSPERPAHLDRRVELVIGDVTDPDAVAAAVEGADAAIHLAAAVGVGQSMYQAVHYTRTNNLGTAVLMEALAQHPVERLVVASSMSVYGEGMCRTNDGRPVAPAERSRRQLERRAWEITGEDGSVLDPVPTPEGKTPMLSSLYALSKYDQERMSLLLGGAYGIPVVALRLFNVYGTRQSLSNPYTGVLAIFASRLMNEKPPLIFEDGGQRRDFVHVSDVARACRLTLEADDVSGEVINIGSGEARTVREVAERLARVMDVPIEPGVTGDYRVGDIRHCFADISRARDRLGYRPAMEFDEGLRELARWLESQHAEDRVEDAKRELLDRGLAL